MNQLPLIPAATYRNYASEAEWLESRRSSIGSSDTPAVVGYSRWKSPIAVWDAKHHPRPNQPEIIHEVGHALEPLIADLLTRESNIEVCDPGDYCQYVSNEWEWLSCTPDRLTHQGEPVELKTAWFESAKIWKEKVPLDYQIQCQHQMAVLGAPLAYIAVLLNGSGFKWHVVKRHQAWCDQIVKRTGDFYRENMLGGAMPAVDGSDSTRKVLESLYPTHEETIVELADEWTARGKRWDKLQRIEAKAKRYRAELGNLVRAEIGEASYGREPMGSGWHWNGRLTRKAEIKCYE